MKYIVAAGIIKTEIVLLSWINCYSEYVCFYSKANAFIRYLVTTRTRGLNKNCFPNKNEHCALIKHNNRRKIDKCVLYSDIANQGQSSTKIASVSHICYPIRIKLITSRPFQPWHS